MSRAVIVTGAAGGIGAALCERMRKDGYTTIGIDKDVAPAADVYLQVDLSESEQLVDLGRELAGDYKLKAVVHNGAVQPIAGAGETPFDVWTNALRVNVIAVDALMSGTHENLAVNNGSIVVISSVHGRATTEASRRTQRRRPRWRVGCGPRLWTLARASASTPSRREPSTPRSFARDSPAGETAEERKALLRQRTALRRIGEPSDVAGAVSFLIGDDARFITGTVLVVDGGATARLGSE